jgi:hypothetical protein
LTQSLPEKGPNREIFLRALREYSDSCQPPALTPGCPFAYDIEPGVRGCGEECIDILTQYNAPPSVDEVFVDNGVSIRKRRPRSRRGPSRSSKPFDVSEMYLTDREISDITKWRIAALMEGLKRELSWQETKEELRRLENIERIRNELNRRHVDTESLIRYGFASHIAISIYLARVIADLLDDTTASYPGLPSARRWFDIIEPSVKAEDGEKSATATLDGSELLALTSWVRSASLDDIINWTPPVDISEHSSHTDQTDKPEWGWLADRFTETYLSSWRKSSLREEWRYIRGGRLAPCGNGDMSSRKVDELELGRVLLDKLLEGEDRENAARSSPTPHYVDLALKLLKDGRRDTAAAVFEAAVLLAPENGELFNNWAFCLIPDDPERALKLLDSAEALGMAFTLTLVGNRLYCFLRTERYTTGLAYAEDICSNWDKLGGEVGYMWTTIDGELLVSEFHLRAYVLDLVDAIARATGDDMIKSRWGKKTQSMREKLEDL